MLHTANIHHSTFPGRHMEGWSGTIPRMMSGLMIGILGRMTMKNGSQRCMKSMTIMRGTNSLVCAGGLCIANLYVRIGMNIFLLFL